jgi:hypothetical protein
VGLGVLARSRREIVDADNRVTAIEQAVGQVGTDEAGAAGE